MLNKWVKQKSETSLSAEADGTHTSKEEEQHRQQRLNLQHRKTETKHPTFQLTSHNNTPVTLGVHFTPDKLNEE